jgi:hypothetical protein
MPSLINTLRKVKLYPGDRPGTDSSDVLAVMASAQRLPGLRKFFSITFKIMQRVPFGKMNTSILESKEIHGIITKFTSEEGKLYNNTLGKLGFPKLRFGPSGKVTDFVRDTVKVGKNVLTRVRPKQSTMQEKKIKDVMTEHINYLTNESFFQKAHKQAKQKSLLTRNKVTREFYHNYAAEFGLNYRSRQMIKTGGRKTNNVVVGRMYFFRYKPEAAEESYDSWPLLLSLYEDGDNISGVNFHHLNYKYRIIQLGRMLDYLNNQEYKKTSRLYASKFRRTLWTHRLFKHSKASYRQYRIDQIQSKIIEVHPLDWELAITVPTEKFMGIRGNLVDRNRMWKETNKRAKEL